MSHGKLREDKTCLNCGHQVEERYCPHCGQENTERRQPFYFLFTHFIEDFTHYDGQFWGTVKNLLFKPGKLTNTYLEGKRQKFVPPVKLYIFVSFITFFVFALFPMVNIGSSKERNTGENGKTNLLKVMKPVEKQKLIDSIKAKKHLNGEDSLAIEGLKAVPDSSEIEDIIDMDKKIDPDVSFGEYKTRKAYDSAKAKNPSSLTFIEAPIVHKFFELKEKGVKKKEIMAGMVEKSFHNLPKALFIYLPLFAFFLWVFHSKKKWWYFDHGIFTLHYFSFLLLTILLIFLLSKLAGLTDLWPVNTILYLAISLLSLYTMAYFFIAHRRVYRAHGLVSIIVGMILFTINFIAFMFLLLGLALISFMMIH
ncbi:DUF3667 domain-containing protein [Chryseobacterium sp. AG844]|uniref:DUF3667 domain-containing protein n=1 Tax=Chryseobacterium sp. AG844 TaxID=2183998 RepID=UPI000D71C70D|nr:DUF3667 domain-containing protein [Chryseobacterium sp. AG844]PWW17127.1 uncharacterized protein DUF3667 [Chryseobacterium sp. AG844]